MTASSKMRRTLEAQGEQGATGFMLTPSAQAALLYLDALQTNLQIWRGVADSVRDSVRTQQDAMLKIFLARSTESSTQEASTENEGQAPAPDHAATFFMPVLAARRAYVQMSGAMISAQRDALAALVQVQRAN